MRLLAWLWMKGRVGLVAGNIRHKGTKQKGKGSRFKLKVNQVASHPLDVLASTQLAPDFQEL